MQLSQPKVGSMACAPSKHAVAECAYQRCARPNAWWHEVAKYGRAQTEGNTVNPCCHHCHCRHTADNNASDGTATDPCSAHTERMSWNMHAGV